MAGVWGIYRRPHGDEVALAATEEDKANYAAKGFKYLKAAEQPGMEGQTPDAEVHAAALRAQLNPPKAPSVPKP